MPNETEDLLKEVSKQLIAVNDKLSKTAEETGKEIKNLGGLSDETKTRVDGMLTQQTALNAKVEKLTAELTALEQRQARNGSDRQIPKTIGHQLVSNDKLKAYASSHGRSKVSIDVQMTTTSTGLVADDGGAVVQPERLPGIQLQPKQRLFLRDLLSKGNTQAPSISYVRQTGFTNNAGVVSEGTAKQYSEITFDTQFTPVTTIAHMFKASVQILADFGQLQSTVDTELRYGLKYVEEREMLLGDGTGIHINGIIPQATAYYAQFHPTNQTAIDDIRLGLLQSQLARLPANGIVLHFTDWAKIELTKDDLGRYLLANPQGVLGPTLWGLPVVATEVPELEGDFLLGPFAGGAQIFDREDANVVLSTENDTDFEKNLVSIRCEERLALAVYRPEGFITGAFTVET